jgi:hypothetical protein
MTATVLPQETLDLLDPAHITPMVTYLASEQCESTGDVYELGGGWYSKVRWQRSQGVQFKSSSTSSSSSSNAVITAETIAESMHQINDFSTDRNTYPTCPTDGNLKIDSKQTIILPLIYNDNINLSHEGYDDDFKP